MGLQIYAASSIIREHESVDYFLKLVRTRSFPLLKYIPALKLEVLAQCTPL